MSWSDVTITMLRHVIMDVDDPQTYTDSRLELALLVGAQFVNNEFAMNPSYAVDFNLLSISPDPTAVPTDPWMVNLTVLRTAIMMLSNDLKVAGMSAWSIKDIGTNVDLRSMAAVKKQLLDELKKVYADAALTFAVAVRPAGKAILSPINISISHGSTYPWWYGGGRY